MVSELRWLPCTARLGAAFLFLELCSGHVVIGGSGSGHDDSEGYGASVRLLGAGGTTESNVGVLQVRTEDGSFGSVCGINLAAADTACRQLGFEHGTASLSPCGTYGAVNLCAVEGTNVAMRDLRCLGGELLITECAWSSPSLECLGHALDSVVYCSGGTVTAGPHEGAVRLLDEGAAPSLNGMGHVEVFVGGTWSTVCGLSSGAHMVLCRAMGFGGVVPGKASTAALVPPRRTKEPNIGDLDCMGTEASTLDCGFDFGEDVYCAASEAAWVHCAGDGDTTGLWN